MRKSYRFTIRSFYRFFFISLKFKVYFRKICNFLIKDLLHLDLRLLKRISRDSQSQLKQRYLYQKRFIKFDIKKGEKVLDFGSGADPFPLATHLADLYSGKTSHRPEGSLVLKDKRPFIKCDIENTPFSNREFDFIYCSHVLEHVKNPAKACEEIMRIGERGYIETPTRMSDILFNFTRLKDHHRWYVNVIDNTLIFIPWRPEERRDTNFGYFFEQAHSKWKNLIQPFFFKNRDLFCNMFLWEDNFYYLVFDEKGKVKNKNFNKEISRFKREGKK